MDVQNVDSARTVPKKFNFWRGIYNKEKNYILGRTPKNWGKYILLFVFKKSTFITT